MKTKKCSICKEIKELLHFYKQKPGRFGVGVKCKDCSYEYSKKYYIKNKERLDNNKRRYRENNKEKLKLYNKQYSSVWYENNKVTQKESSKAYYLKNKKRIIEQHNEYKRNRRKYDVGFRITNNLRRRVSLALEGNPRLDTMINLVGCSIEELKKHLESQFKSGMTWNNYGKQGWEVDHIKPCALFDMKKTKEQKKCFHYSNLQPLWMEENRSKRNIFMGVN